MTKQIVSFNEDGIGEVNKKSFAKGLPEGLSIDTFEQVDNYREVHLAKVSAEMLDYAVEQNIGGGTGNGLSIPNIYLGGQTTANLTFSSDAKFVAEVITGHTNELMGAALGRANDLWAQHNVHELKPGKVAA